MNKREMAKKTDRQQKYLDKYAPRIYSHDGTVPTYAQYLQKEYNETPRTKTTRTTMKNISGVDWENDKPSARFRKRT